MSVNDAYPPIEQLLNIFDNHADLPTTLRRILKFLVSQANCQGGALFLQGKKAAQEPFWLYDRVSDEWQAWIESGEENEFSCSMQSMLQSGLALPAKPSFHLAGGIVAPVDETRVVGVLFFGAGGQALSDEELELCTRLLRSILAKYQFRAADQDLLSENFCDLLTQAQDIYAGFGEIQMRVVDGIQKILEPDGTNIFYYFPNKNKLVEKVSYLPSTERIQQTSVYLRTSLLEQVIQEKTARVVTNLTSHSLFFQEIDGMEEGGAVVAVFIPMIVNREVVGAVELLFKHLLEISPFHQNLLNAIVKTLGYSIVNTRHIQQLRVANADVEANRWEIIRSRNILRALFDSLPFSIYIVDTSYKITAVNISRANRLNLHPTQLVGKQCFEALFGRSEVCPGCLVNETLFTGKDTTRHSQIWVDDQPIEWEIGTFAVLYDNNRPGQAIVIEQDVTEKRRLEASLIQSEKLAAVGQLAAGVVHEINNPLTAIIANAQILARELADDEEKLESVKLIELAGGRASQVVKNLLGFARKEYYDFKWIDLNDTVQNALKLLQHKLVSQSVLLKDDLGENLPPVLASHDHLEGVWVNLINNAMDALNGTERRISISTRFANNEFRISIGDNGHGIPPEKISHIFEPFYTTKGVSQGTGLGLSISHQIIKNHGGYISVDSQVGVGTKFTVVIPLNNRPG